MSKITSGPQSFSDPMRQSRSTGSAGKKKVKIPSFDTNRSDEDGPQSTLTNASGLAELPISRLERKRHQEKRRRHEFKDALNNLQAILLKHDEDFLHKSQEREQRRSGMATAGAITQQEKEDNTLFNRVELVNQAIITIRGFCHQNDILKTVIADLKAGRDTLATAPSALPSTRGTAAAYARPPMFHWEIGPPGSISNVETSAAQPKTAIHEPNLHRPENRNRNHQLLELSDSSTLFHTGKRRRANQHEDQTCSDESHVLFPSTLLNHSAVNPVLPYLAQSQILVQMQQQLNHQGLPTMESPTSQLLANIGSAGALHLPPTLLRDALHWGLPSGSSRLPGHNELLELLPAASRGGRESSLLPQSTHTASLTAQRPDVGGLSSSFKDNVTTFHEDEE